MLVYVETVPEEEPTVDACVEDSDPECKSLDSEQSPEEEIDKDGIPRKKATGDLAAGGTQLVLHTWNFMEKKFGTM